MKSNWFKRRGYLFIPISMAGWMIFLFTLAASVFFFFQIDSHSHSVSDSLMNFVIDLGALIVFYTLIAYYTTIKE